MNPKPLTFEQFKSEVEPHIDLLFGGKEVDFDECGNDSHGYFSACSGLINVAYYRTGYHNSPWHIKIFGQGERYGKTIAEAMNNKAPD